MKETIRDVVEAYIATRTDLRESTVAGYRAIAESQIYERYGDLSERAIESVWAFMSMQNERDCSKGAKLLRSVAVWWRGVETWRDLDDGGHGESEVLAS